MHLKPAAKCFSYQERLGEKKRRGCFFFFFQRIFACWSRSSRRLGILAPVGPSGKPSRALSGWIAPSAARSAYRTLVLDPGGGGGGSTVLTPRPEMSLKSHPTLSGRFYFPRVRLQGQFAPTADERSIGDLNLKSRGPRGRSVAGACCCPGGGVGGGGLSPEAQQRPISSHPHLPKLG